MCICVYQLTQGVLTGKCQQFWKTGLRKHNGVCCCWRVGRSIVSCDTFSSPRHNIQKVLL